MTSNASIFIFQAYTIDFQLSHFHPKHYWKDFSVACCHPFLITWWSVLHFFCLCASYCSLFLVIGSYMLHVVKNIALRKPTWIGGRNVGKNTKIIARSSNLSALCETCWQMLRNNMSSKKNSIIERVRRCCRRRIHFGMTNVCDSVCIE